MKRCVQWKYNYEEEHSIIRVWLTIVGYAGNMNIFNDCTKCLFSYRPYS